MVATHDLREEYRAYLQPPWVWRALIRRARGISKQDKYVLTTLADYAGKSGTEVKPGLALLAADSDSTYEQAQAAVKLARELGLLFLAFPGNRRRRTADEYWLIMHPNAVETAAAAGVEYESPAARELRAEQIRRGRRSHVEKSALKKKESKKESEGPTDPQNPSIRGSEEPSNPETSEGPSDPQNPGTEGSSDPQKPVFEGPWDPPTSPVLNLVTKNSTSPTADASRTELASVRAHAREEDQIVRVVKCPHGNNPRTNRHGEPRCEQCRTEQQDTAPVAESIPVPVVDGPSRFTATRCTDHGLPVGACTFCRRQLPGRAAA